MNMQSIQNRRKLVLLVIEARNRLQAITYEEAAQKIGHNYPLGVGQAATSAAVEYWIATGDADLFSWLVQKSNGRPGNGYYEFREAVGLPVPRIPA